MVVPFQCTDEDIRTAGLACSDDDPCPVYLELSSAASTGLRIFAAGDIHTASATLYSVLLGSEDNGHTWREVHERIRSSSLDRLEIAGVENGWVSGLTLSPLPQDPFFLRTTDGGKTWRNVAIFSETRYGSILQYAFGEKLSGELIIDHGAGSGGDRYERYESEDGGDSWSIKESSTKALALKHPAPAATEWRIRADGASKSFQIEHRQGQRWVGMASFAVNLGSCKPPE